MNVRWHIHKTITVCHESDKRPLANSYRSYKDEGSDASIANNRSIKSHTYFQSRGATRVYAEYWFAPRKWFPGFPCIWKLRPFHSLLFTAFRSSPAAERRVWKETVCNHSKSFKQGKNERADVHASAFTFRSLLNENRFLHSFISAS